MKNLYRIKKTFLIALLASASCFLSDISVLHAQSNNDEFCPSPRASLEQNLTDFETVQEDIIRLNLCVQRAELLNSLNSLVSQNANTIDSSIQKEIEAIESSLNLQSVAPPSLPSTGQIGLPEPDANLTAHQWKILEIFGSQGLMMAKVLGHDGQIRTIKAGDKLADDLIVETINISGVTVSLGSTSMPLEWSE